MRYFGDSKYIMQLKIWKPIIIKLVHNAVLSQTRFFKFRVLNLAKM